MSTDPSVWDEIRRCEEQYERNPESLVFARLADAYRKAGEIDLALKVVEDGISRHPDYLSGYIVLGRCHTDLKRNGDAIAAFERVAELDPTNLVAIGSLAELTREGGDTDGARGWYTRLTQLDPLNDEATRVLRELGGPVEPPAKTAEHDGESEAVESVDETSDPFRADPSLDESAPLTGESTWRTDLSDTPEPIDLGGIMDGMELDEAKPLVGDGELLDWSTGEIVHDGEETIADLAGPPDESRPDEAPRESPVLDDLWLEDLDSGEVPLEELEAPTAADPLAMSDPLAPTDPLASTDPTIFGDVFSTSGPLDDLGPAEEVAPAEIELEVDSLAEIEPEIEPEVDSLAEIEPEAAVSDGSWTAGAWSDGIADIPPKEVDQEHLEEVDSVLEELSAPDLADSEPAPDLADSEPEPAPEDQPAASDAPWWEELAQAGVSIGSDADIGSVVDEQSPPPAKDAVEERWREEEPDMADTPTPGGSDDADIMTRTMADLYADQGLYEEAIEIYEELLTDRPDDEEIRARLESVQARSRRREPIAHEPAIQELDAADAVDLVDSVDSMDSVEQEVSEDGDDTIPIAAYRPSEIEEETGPWIAEELAAVLRAGERLADERGAPMTIEQPGGPEESHEEPGHDGILEDWLRRLKE
jgi:tetratricopeptide (TPR) repeat protein